MDKTVVPTIVTKYFGDCTIDSDFLQFLDHKVELDSFVSELNEIYKTSVKTESLIDLKYLYNSLPLSRVVELFEEEAYNTMASDESVQKEQNEIINDQFDNIYLNLESYKKEKERIVSSSSFNDCGDITQIEKQLLTAIDRAKSAYAKSEEAKQIKAGILSGNKNAIESLQSAVVKLAEAGETQVTALMAQLIYLQRLARLSKEIMALGVSNIHSIRTIISKLEGKLKDPCANLDNIEINEFKKLICELKQKEDIFSRIERQKEGLQVHENVLIQHSKDIDSIKKKLGIT